MQVRSLIVAPRTVGLSWPSIVATAAGWSIAVTLLTMSVVRLVAPGYELIGLCLFGAAFAFCTWIAGMLTASIVLQVERDRENAEYLRMLEQELD